MEEYDIVKFRKPSSEIEIPFKKICGVLTDQSSKDLSDIMDKIANEEKVQRLKGIDNPKNHIDSSKSARYWIHKSISVELFIKLVECELIKVDPEKQASLRVFAEDYDIRRDILGLPPENNKPSSRYEEIGDFTRNLSVSSNEQGATQISA